MGGQVDNVAVDLLEADPILEASYFSVFWVCGGGGIMLPLAEISALATND